MHGPAGQKEVDKAIFAAFSEMCVTAEDTIVEGDRVVERHAITAVHTGMFNNVPATGRKVYWTENHIYRIGALGSLFLTLLSCISSLEELRNL